MDRTIPDVKGVSVRLSYIDKIAGGRSSLVLAFKSRTKTEFQLTALKELNDVLMLI